MQIRIGVVLILAGLISACGEDVTGPEAVARVEVTPSSETLTALNQTQEFAATAFNSSGSRVGEISFRWSSSDPDVVSVDSHGVATSLAKGTAKIRATVARSDVSGSATLSVIQMPVSVEVTPSSAELTAFGASEDFEATVKDKNGFAISGTRVEWSVSPDSVAAITDDGTATAQANGVARIQAAVSDVSDSAKLTVDQEVDELSISPQSATLVGIGDSQDFDAAAFDRNGHRVKDPDVAWVTEKPSVALVDSDGTVVSQGLGETEIAAGANSASSRANVTVISEGRLVYATDRDGNREIYTIRVDGTDRTRITDHPATDGNPAWSPDGSEIVFLSRRDNTGIYRVQADGSNVTLVTDRVDESTSPTWSPNGSRIAFRTPDGEIATIRPDGTGFTVVFDSGADPAWSPDSDQIAFTRGGEIWTGNSNGTSSTNTGVGGVQPRWSPDGGRIAFWGNGVETMDPDGTDVAQLTSGRHPSWSPGGDRIAFVDGGDIFVIDRDGSDRERVTDDGFSQGGVSWQ